MRRLVLVLPILIWMAALAPARADPAASEQAMAAHRLRVPSREGAFDATLWVPEGFSIGVFASGLGHPRMLAESPSGELLVSEHVEGRVLKLADRDGDGVADESIPLLTGREYPHGLAFAGEVLFVAETHRVLRLDVWWDPSSAREIIRLPGYEHHATRSLAVGPDGRLYVSIGSTCDVCVETDPLRASVWRFNLDGSGGEPYATGLRNAVGLAWEPGGERLWVTENERNELGDDVPPDEINILRQGGDYGWPHCYGPRVPDPTFGNLDRCASTEPPALELPAHVAPLGLAFYVDGGVPGAYRGDLLVALHGSAVRDSPVGYSLVRVPIRDGQPQPAVDFARGWLDGGGGWGRPVAPLVARDGTIYLTDDKAGLIYRIRSDVADAE